MEEGKPDIPNLTDNVSIKGIIKAALQEYEV